MIEIREIRIPVGDSKEHLERKIRKKLRMSGTASEFVKWKILRHSIDARKKPILYDIYTVGVEIEYPGADQKAIKKASSEEERIVKKLHDPEVSIHHEVRYQFPETKRTSGMRPVVIGSGPAGLFCALWLARAGLRPIVLEQGQPVEQRVRDVEHFWKTGVLNPSSNIQFGEGGAGTFSDGKLTTNVKDKYGRNRAVLETFVSAGADEEILCENLPHIGTDVLRKVVVNLRDEIIKCGGEVRFGTKAVGFETSEGCLTGVKVRALRTVTDNEAVEEGRNAGDVQGAGETVSSGDPSESSEDLHILKCDTAVLAVGHSSRDLFRTLYAMKIPMTQKNFAVGFRLSHPQAMINQRQYGISDPSEMKRLGLPAASYKMTAHAGKRGIYTFCMCPGGYVVNASSEKGHLAVNGMSDRARDSGRANSAVVMTVDAADFGSDDVLAGMRFQEDLERRAFELGCGKIPVERFPEFKKKFEHIKNDRTNGSYGEEVQNHCDSESTISDTQRKLESTDSKVYCDFESAGSSTYCGSESTDSSAYCDSESGDSNAQCAPDTSAMENEQRSKPLADTEDLCIRGQYTSAHLERLLPKDLTEDFLIGMDAFDRTIPGYAGNNALVIGLESRTSSPVRILRDDHGECSIRGLYPCGEGAGYAGGIMSAAIDGIKTAEHIIRDD